MKSLYDSALSGISTLLNKRISAANESKSAVIDSLNEEKEAAAEVYQVQIDAIEEQKDAIDDLIKQKQKQIDVLNEEIDKIEKAAETRKKNLDLQQQEYNLQRLLNQKTQAVYTEDKGFVWKTDTSGIREAQEKVTEAKEAIQIDNLKNEISLIQKEIDLLEDKKDALSEQQEQLQKMMDASNKYYDNLIKEQEKYWDSVVKNFENQKSKWEELADIQQIAEAWSYVEQVFGELGYTVEDVLNGNEQAFEDFKAKYVSLLSDMNSNASFAEGLSYASGIAKEELGSFLDKTKETADGLDVLGTKGSELDSVASSMDSLSGSASTAGKSVSDTASNLDDAATNAGTLRDNLTDVNTAISDEQTAFSNLIQTIDEVIEVINEKIAAIQEEQRTVGIATSSEMANFLLLRDKILEVKESIDEVSTTVTDLDAITLDNITNSFQELYDKIVIVSSALGSGIEGSGEGVTNSISSAIQALNNISLEEGIIAQFNNLKTAIDSVTSAISGGGGESSGGQSQGGQSGVSGSGSESGSQGGAANSLSGAITEMGTTANEVIGEPDAEGDGTVIGEFGSLETAVNDVTEAIGIGGESGSEGGSGKGEEDGTLIGSINDLGITSEEVLGESEGDGVIGKFEEFRDVIGEAANHVASISDGLDEIDGKEVECTITVNVKMNGSIPAFASGTVLGNMKIESATYNAKYGNAYASGTIGLPKAEKNALVSEYGQTEMTVFPNGKTVITDSPTMIDLPKDTVIFNEEETKKIIDNKANINGTAHAQGTVDDGVIITGDGHVLRPLQPGDRAYELQQKMNDYLAKMGGDTASLLTPVSAMQKNMEQMTQALNTINNINNSNNRMQNVVNEFHITMPNVTDSTAATELMKDLQALATKKMQFFD